MNRFDMYDFAEYAESGHSFTIYDAKEELAKQERDKEIIYVYPRKEKREKTITEQQKTETEQNLKEIREMREKTKRLRDEAQKAKDKAEALAREHKKTLAAHMKKVSKQLEIAKNENKQLRESLANSKAKFAQIEEELKIYEKLKHITPSGDVVILENELIAKLKDENTKLKYENKKLKAENAAKPKKTYRPPLLEIKKEKKDRSNLKKAALEAIKEKQSVRDANRRAAETRHAKTNALKEQAIQEYKNSGLSKNEFSRRMAEKYHVSLTTMRKNWLQGI